MKTPVVSIITPTYNHSLVIADCIESVLAQTYANWEMLIVDDGSTDNTWKVVERYAAKDSRIKAYRQENKGIMRLAETYNFALKQAQGKFVAILEGDDYWPAEKLASQVPLHEENPQLILSHGRVLIAKPSGQMPEYYRPPQEGAHDTLTYLGWLFLKRSCIMPVSTMVRRDALERIGGFQQEPGRPTVDHTTWLKLFMLPGQVHWSPDLLGYWRQSITQVTKNYGLVLSKTGLESALRSYDALPEALRVQTGVTREALIYSTYERVILPSYLTSLRQALLEKDQVAAERFARELIKHGAAKRRAQGYVGLLAARLGLNIEVFFRVYKRLHGTLRRFA